MSGPPVDLEGDASQQDVSNRSGFAFEATAAVDGLECRLSAWTAGALTAYLTDDSGSVLERRSIATLEPGEAFTFTTELAAGETYWVLCDARGREYVRGRTAVDYPIEGDALVVTNGIFTAGGSVSTSYRYCVDRIRPVTDGEPYDLGADEEAQSWGSLDQPAGVRLHAAADVGGIECRLSAETDGVTDAYLTDDDGDVLEHQSIAGLESGDTVSFDGGLAADETYWLVFDADGESYVRGRAAADYPIVGDSLIVSHGIYGGDAWSENYRYCIDRIELSETGDPTGRGLDLEFDDVAQSWSSLDEWSGVRLQVTESVAGLECRLSAETDGVTTAYLVTDDGDVLERQTVETLEPGETFAFETALEPDETYRLVCDARGRSYIRGRAAIEYPVEGSALTVTDGVFGGGALSDGYRYCIDRIVPTRANHATPDLPVETGLLELGTDEEAQSWGGLDQPAGVRVEVTAPARHLQCRLSAETEVTTAYLADDAGNVLSQQSVADLSPGETFTFDTALGAGEAYWVLCDGNGESFVRGRTAIEYPAESAHLEATHGIYGGELFSEDYRYCIDQIRTDEASPNVDTLGLGNDEEVQAGFTSWSGVRVQASAPVRGLQCRLSGETDVEAAYLTDDSGDVLRQLTIGNLDAGDTFTFDVELETGDVCWVLCDGDGDGYARGRAAADYPLEGELLSATHGIYTGESLTENYRYCIDQVQTVSARGGLTATLEDRSLDVTTVNVVDDPAIDETGDLAGELLAYLDDQSEVSHEFVLPPGSYAWNTEFVLFDPVEYLELRGEPRATLQIRDHDVDTVFELGSWADDDPPQHVVLQSVDIDIDDESERDAGLVSAHVGRCYIDNVELVGQRWRHGPYGGNRYTSLINTRDGATLSMVRNLSLPDGEVADASEPSVGHSIGLSADPPHEGITVWHQCYVEDYIDNGFYVSNSPGENLVVHGTAVNCGNGTLRIGATDEARDCKVLLDAASDQLYPGAGLWFNGGEPLAERIEIDGSDAQNDLVRINSSADGGYITDLDVFCGPNVVAPTIRCTYTDDTEPSGLLIEGFAVDDVTTADDNASVRIRRPDVTLSSGTVDAANRPALGGYYDPGLDDVDLS
ncbi:hypothetical protein [Natronococcus sp.]|uniref:hypothetical protein n=1 Tax=Natronococcus sp. TaxID=35747 RepID=UPI003A4D3A26